MTESRDLPTLFRRRVLAARVAAGLGVGFGLAVALMALFADARQRAGFLIVGAAFLGSGHYWAIRLYRCSRCDARIIPDRGVLLGTPPAGCPKCQQKLGAE